MITKLYANELHSYAQLKTINYSTISKKTLMACGLSHCQCNRTVTYFDKLFINGLLNLFYEKLFLRNYITFTFRIIILWCLRIFVFLAFLPCLAGSVYGPITIS